MNIPFIDLVAQYNSIRGEIDEAIHQAMLNSSYDSMRMNPDELNRYYIYKYLFISPEEAKKYGDDGLPGEEGP